MWPARNVKNLSQNKATLFQSSRPQISILKLLVWRLARRLELLQLLRSPEPLVVFVDERLG